MHKKMIINILVILIVIVCSKEIALADVYNILDYQHSSDTWDTALNNALDALLNDNDDGGIIYFPPGLYDFESKINLTISNKEKSIIFQGASSSATTLRWADSSQNHGFYINYTGVNGFYDSNKGGFKFEKMTLLTSDTTETAIKIQCPENAGPTPQKEFSDLVIAGTSSTKTWATGIALIWCPFTNMDNIKFQGKANVTDRVGTAILINSGTDYFCTRLVPAI